MTRHHDRDHDRGRVGQGQGDLFDLLPEPTADAPMHLLMPNMGLACGRDTLTVLRSRRRGGRTITTLPAQATCPDCQAVPDVLKRIHDMQHGRR